MKLYLDNFCIEFPKVIFLYYLIQQKKDQRKNKIYHRNSPDISVNKVWFSHRLCETQMTENGAEFNVKYIIKLQPFVVNAYKYLLFQFLHKPISDDFPFCDSDLNEYLLNKFNSKVL